MSQIRSDFHENVECLRAFLVPTDGGSGERSTGSNSGNHAVRFLGIRRCMRSIQNLMAREDFCLPSIHRSTSGSAITTNNEGDGVYNDSLDSIVLTSEQQRNDSRQELGFYDDMTCDLMFLLTLDLEVLEDTTSIQLFQEAILPPTIALCLEAPCMADPALSSLFHRIVCYLRSQTHMAQLDHLEGSIQEQLLKIFNHHVGGFPSGEAKPTCSSFFETISDQDLFVALHIVLHYQELWRQHFSSQSSSSNHEEPPPLALAVLINNIIEYLTTMKSRHPDDGIGISTIMVQDPKNIMMKTAEHSSIDLTAWLSRHLLQHNNPSHVPPQMLRKDVESFKIRLDQYGVYLIESSLRLLGEGTNMETSVNENINCDDEPKLRVLLRYATLATSILGALGPTTLTLGGQGGDSDTSGMLALSRTLWREYIHFSLHRLDNQQTTSLTTHLSSASPPPMQVLHLAFTDILWRLALLHYPLSSQKTSTNLGSNEDVQLIAGTILRLWKYGNLFWNERTEDWTRHLLQQRFPASSFGGRALRHSLQAMILSYATFPSPGLSSPYPGRAVEGLISLLSEESSQGHANDMVPIDPWNGWVLQQLSKGCHLQL